MGGTNQMFVGFRFISKEGDNCSMDLVTISPTPTVPPMTTLRDLTVLNGQTTCYDATQTITVAGSGTSFNVMQGGYVTMIAGQSIDILPTTHIASGAYFRAYIAPNGPWCTAPLMPATVAGKGETQALSESGSFRIYPNPTPGNFTVELTGENQSNPVRVQDPVRVEVYDLRGERILNGTIIGEKSHEFSLSEAPDGLYFVKIVANNESKVLKLVKTR